MSASMFSRRAMQVTTRRLVAANPSAFSKTALSRLPAPAVIATGQHLQYRQAATTTTSQEAGSEILAAQRRNRPVSPHLSIYQPQITWYLSILHRITGASLSGAIYVFGAAYLVSPLFGWHLESASLAASFATLPMFLKIGLKSLIAFPFTFHCFNGLRHLVWDTGSAFTNKQVIQTGWTVVGLSVASALALTFM
ncbi:succinate dehydrogenase, cytochrome b556 subunit [Rhinocladiella mackenziei CBS 650.93]|uniref:Succinate dehydrogenase, cytochrome b556 subunit n=1 Tax=Rhinocladiella mackenziei CBS 650.93 TaxID=1442369 RepID=A0A0D2IUQ7_9EURO|nr:succinate dehydrogenase, cytochrome b556 subunit [Rhinocladiella mackenziei CBS 650.93]KIX09834.1 succinate dehydrogenase, cytochrome b556 subunit [Rhinocladiella mackenziei CBS 650.93]